MSEEKKDYNESGCKCNCFKKLVLVVIGSFIGAYLALTLFAVVNKQLPIGGVQPPPCHMEPTEPQFPPDFHLDPKPHHMDDGHGPNFKDGHGPDIKDGHGHGPDVKGGHGPNPKK